MSRFFSSSLHGKATKDDEDSGTKISSLRKQLYQQYETAINTSEKYKPKNTTNYRREPTYSGYNTTTMKFRKIPQYNFNDESLVSKFGGISTNTSRYMRKSYLFDTSDDDGYVPTSFSSRFSSNFDNIKPTSLSKYKSIYGGIAEQPEKELTSTFIQDVSLSDDLFDSTADTPILSKPKSIASAKKDQEKYSHITPKYESIPKKYTSNPRSRDRYDDLSNNDSIDTEILSALKNQTRNKQNDTNPTRFSRNIIKQDSESDEIMQQKPIKSKYSNKETNLKSKPTIRINPLDQHEYSDETQELSNPYQNAQLLSEKYKQKPSAQPEESFTPKSILKNPKRIGNSSNQTQQSADAPNRYEKPAQEPKTKKTTDFSDKFDQIQNPIINSLKRLSSKPEQSSMPQENTDKSTRNLKYTIPENNSISAKNIPKQTLPGTITTDKPKIEADAAPINVFKSKSKNEPIKDISYDEDLSIGTPKSKKTAEQTSPPISGKVDIEKTQNKEIENEIPKEIVITPDERKKMLSDRVLADKNLLDEMKKFVSDEFIDYDFYEEEDLSYEDDALKSFDDDNIQKPTNTLPSKITPSQDENIFNQIVDDQSAPKPRNNNFNKQNEKPSKLDDVKTQPINDINKVKSALPYKEKNTKPATDENKSIPQQSIKNQIEKQPNINDDKLFSNKENAQQKPNLSNDESQENEDLTNIEPNIVINKQKEEEKITPKQDLIKQPIREEKEPIDEEYDSEADVNFVSKDDDVIDREEEEDQFDLFKPRIEEEEEEEVINSSPQKRMNVDASIQSEMMIETKPKLIIQPVDYHENEIGSMMTMTTTTNDECIIDDSMVVVEKVEETCDNIFKPGESMTIDIENDSFVEMDEDDEEIAANDIIAIAFSKDKLEPPIKSTIFGLIHIADILIEEQSQYIGLI